MSAKTNHREHEELVALIAAGCTDGLSKAESATVAEHLESCEECRQAAEEYKLLCDYGRALPKEHLNLPKPEAIWNHEQQRAMLLARVRSTQENDAGRGSHDLAGLQRRMRYAPLAAGALAAVLLLGLVVGYEYGSRVHQDRKPISSSSGTQIVSAYQSDDERENQRRELDSSKERVAAAGRHLAELKAMMSSLVSNRADLEARNRELSEQISRSSQVLKSVIAEKEGTARSLAATEEQLQTVQQQLKDVRDQRSQDLVRVATAEFKLQQVSSEGREKDKTIARQQQYLEADRDIRELMGARQLYIADVVDVDREGRDRKPFGRVFYTKGKSLIFYGFDLDQQPGVRDASVFQVWGHSDNNAKRPVSLGIFYRDNATNYRWVLKADNPELLSQLDAVFVTMEKDGVSLRPTGKPFLYTYLRKGEPNHP